MSNRSYNEQSFHLKKLHNQRLAREKIIKSSIGTENYNAIKKEKVKDVEKELKKNSFKTEKNADQSGKRKGIVCFSDEKLEWDKQELKKETEGELEDEDGQNQNRPRKIPIKHTSTKSKVCLIL